MKFAILLFSYSVLRLSIDLATEPVSQWTQADNPPTGKEMIGSGGNLQPVPLNALLYWITKFFPFDAMLKKAGDLTLDAEIAVASTLGIETTQDTVCGRPCASLTIIFARGTSEAGNVGVLVGPEFFDAVAARLGNGSTLAVLGVDYKADIPGFLEGGDPDGSWQMADDVTRALTACPGTNLVMAGYSQGGQIVHNAVKLLPAAELARVGSAVIFGDPKYPAEVVGIPVAKQLVICHDTDDICGGGDMIHLSHLTYARDVDLAADFVVAQF